MDIDQMPEEMRTLCLRAGRATEETAAVRQQLDTTRQATRALIARAQRVHLDDVWTQPRQAIEAPMPLSAHDAQLLAARQMRDILNDFPLEQQAAILKALTMRTMALIQDTLRTPIALSA